MELALIIYLIDVMDSLDSMWLVAIPVIVLFVLFIAHAFWFDCLCKNDKEKQKTTLSLVKWTKRCSICIAISSMVVLLTPSRETSMTMLAAYAVQTAYETEEVREIAGKSLAVINKYMDEYLKERIENGE